MHIQHHPLPAHSAGNERSLHSLHFGSKQSAKKTYIQASLHADEIPGMLVAQHLRRELTALEAQGKIEGEIVLLPVANPVGLAQSLQSQAFGRFDMATGINFNRAYRNLAPQLKQTLAGKLSPHPAENIHLIRQAIRTALAQWEVHSETQAMKKILQTLAMDADIVLDLHCDNEAVLHLYTGTPLAAQALPLAQLLGAHALLLAKESGDDPFDETCSRLWWELAEHFGPAYPIPPACLAVTVELRGQTEVCHEHARRDASALLAFLALQGHINVNTEALPASRCEATPLEGVEKLCAPQAGIIVFHKEPGAQVQAGDTIAELIDPLSGEVKPVRAAVAGCMFARTHLRYAQRGMDLAKIAGKVAFRSGKLLSL